MPPSCAMPPSSSQPGHLAQHTRAPILTFHAPGKVFQRACRGSERSLAETKSFVRRKLTLPKDAAVRLVRLQSGLKIDLDDEGDFDALREFLSPGALIDISVGIGDASPPEVLNYFYDGSRKRKRDTQIPGYSNTPGPSTSTTPSIAAPSIRATPDLPSELADVDDTFERPRKKRRKVKQKLEPASHVAPETPQSPVVQPAPPEPPSQPTDPLPKKREDKKGKQKAAASQPAQDAHKTNAAPDHAQSTSSAAPAPASDPAPAPAPNAAASPAPAAAAAAAPDAPAKRKRKGRKKEPVASAPNAAAPAPVPPPQPVPQPSDKDHAPGNTKEKKRKRAELPAAADAAGAADADADADARPASPVNAPAAKKSKKGEEKEKEKEEKGREAVEQPQGGDAGAVPEPDTAPPAEGGKSIEKGASEGRKEGKRKRLAAGSAPPVSTTDPAPAPAPAPSTAPGAPGADEQSSPKKKRNRKSKGVEASAEGSQPATQGASAGRGAPAVAEAEAEGSTGKAQERKKPAPAQTQTQTAADASQLATGVEAKAKGTKKRKEQAQPAEAAASTAAAAPPSQKSAGASQVQAQEDAATEEPQAQIRVPAAKEKRKKKTGPPEGAGAPEPTATQSQKETAARASTSNAAAGPSSEGSKTQKKAAAVNGRAAPAKDNGEQRHADGESGESGRQHAPANGSSTSMWEQVRAAAAAVLARSAAAKAAPAKTAAPMLSAATDQPLTLAEPTATVPTPASATSSKKKAARRTASEAAAHPVPLPSKVTGTKSKAPAVAPPMPSSQSQAPDRPPPEFVEASAEAEAWKTAYSAHASSDVEPDAAPPAPKEPGSTRRRKDKDAMTPCPVCRKVPFHYRYLCPVVLAGPEAIEVRLAELTSEGQRDRGLVESLKAHLAKARRAKKAKSVTIQVPRAMSDTTASAAERDESSSADEQGPAGASPESTSTDADDATEEKAEMPVSTAPSLPKLFAGSQIAEVSVETQDEGSSNDESDDSDEESDENDQESDENDEESDNDDDAILKNIDPETLLHGPYSRKSILDQLPSSDSSGHSADERDGSDVDAEEEEIELDRRYRRLSRRYEQASSTEDESDAAVEDNGQTYMDADPQDAVEQRDVNLSVAATLADSDERAELEGSATKVVAPVPDDRASDETGEDGVVPSSQPSEEQSVVQWQRSRLGSEDESNTGSRRVSSVAQDTVQVKQNAQLAQNGGHTTGSDAVANNVRSPSHTPEPAIVPVVTPAKSGKLINGGASAAANSSRKLVKKLSSKSDLAPETIDSSSLPVNNDETPAQTDPIETAEDPETAAQSAVDDDPIQDADGFVTPPNKRQLSPPVKTPKSGTIKRMKDRHGRLPEADIELPSLTPELAAAAQSTPAPTADDEAERRTTRMTTRRAASTAAMPPPPLPPALAAASKRRVRLTEEVKAERKAERERIAAEKKAAKEKEKGEKAAQKEAEKAARKGTAKARLQKAQTQEKKGSGKTQTAPSAADDDGSDIADVSNADTIVPTVRKAIPSATQGSPQSAPAGGQNASLLAQSESQSPMWTVLAQTPSMREESIDELQYPSSPALTSTGVDGLAAKNTLRAEDTDAREQGAQNNSDPFAFDQTQKQNGAATSSLQEKARPPGTASQGDVSTADPLFFPSSSQFPIALDDSQNSADGQDSDSDEDSEEELQLPKPTRVLRPWTAAAPFRRLSDLASQPLFSSTLNTSMSFSLTPMPPKTAPGTAKKKVDDTSDDDDDDDEDETESDSDAQDRSHIPLGRRAGAGVPKKKKSGLASFRY